MQSIPKKLPPSAGQILYTCAVLQDISAPVQFERRWPGDKDQGKPKMALESSSGRTIQPWARCSCQSWEDTSRNPRKDGSRKLQCNRGTCMTFWQKSCYIKKISSMISLYVESNYYSRVGLRTYIKKAGEFIFIIIWTLIPNSV